MFKNNRDIILLVLTVSVVYLIYKNCDKKENFAETTISIKDEINKIYKADIESIRNLAEISQKLQSGGLIIPGNLQVRGSFNYLPRGSIIAFNGSKAPEGWAFCDGKNGTPDLRGRFIYGYGKQSGNKIGRTGGEEMHTLNVNEMPRHNHNMRANGNHSHRIGTRQDDWNGSGGAGPSFGGDNGNFRFYNRAKISVNGNHTHYIYPYGGNKPHNNMPPYYVLSWIMKL